MRKKALVIGATGLLGYGIATSLDKSGWDVRAIGKEDLTNIHIFPNTIEYICGDFYDDLFLSNMLRGIDKVYYFISSTFPSTSLYSLEQEITRTLKGLDYLLGKMRENDISEIVYPSSGGTIYGDVKSGMAKETDVLRPTTPYGVGKKMCEDILNYYSLFGISSTILRVGNVYGSSLARTATQGVIDVFIQKALRRETATIWGDALTNIRDYIFADDFAEAVVAIGNKAQKGVNIYNLSTGVGTSLKDIIEVINLHTTEPLQVNYIASDNTSSIKRIVLDMSKFKKETGWEPKYNIKTGIAKTIIRKQQMIEL